MKKKIICPECNGTKKIVGLGYMPLKCLACDADGNVEIEGDKNDDDNINNVVDSSGSMVFDLIKATKDEVEIVADDSCKHAKHRGRPKKVQDDQ
jgi:hypothetical protein